MDRLLAVFRDIGAVVVAIVTPILRSFRQNSGLAVLSVVLAFGIWIVVSDAENPETTRVVPVDIPVEPVNVESDVAVDSLDPTVIQVRVRVEEDVLDTLTAADFEATVDLQGLNVGELTLDVEVRPLTQRGGLRIEDVLPATTEVTIVQLALKSVPVEIDPVGNPPDGFTMSVPEPETDNVNVEGPQSKVSQVAKVTASLNVENKTEPIDQAVRLEPRNSRGTLITGVSVVPAVIKVTVDITQQTFSRPVVVSPVLSGSPAEGFVVTGLSVDPATVTVTGSESFIQLTSLIKTEPIDITDADSSVVRSVALAVPTGADEVLGELRVAVSITIRPLTDTTIQVSITVQNLGSDLSIAGPLPTIEVMLEGPQPDLIDLEAGDVSATIDLEGKEAGQSEVDIEISAPSALEIREVSPDSITITLVEG